MRTRCTLVTLAAVTAAGLALAGTATADTATISDTAGSCPSQQSLMTSNGSAAVAAANGNSYLCAQEYHSGNRNVGAGSTDVFSESTNVAYYPQYYCWDSSDDKDTKYTHAEIFGSGTVSMTNMDILNNHHWGAGYLFTLEGNSVTGFTNGCNDSSQVWTNPPAIFDITHITASGLPGGNASKAGVAYTVTAQINPGGDASGQTVALQDNGVSVAAATADSTGKATINWTPAVMGARNIQVLWGGTATALGNKTTLLPVTVAGGTGLQIDGTPVYDPTTMTATAKVKVDVTPAPGSTDTLPSQVPVMLVDAATKQPLNINKAPVMATVSAKAPTTEVTITFPFTNNTQYKLMASVQANATNNVQAGQSYVVPVTSPVSTTTTATWPTKVYVGLQADSTVCSLVNVPTTVSPTASTGTVTPSDTGSQGSTLSGGAGTAKWCPPSTAGTYTPTVTYGGDNGHMTSTSAPASGVQVLTGGPDGGQMTLSGATSPNYQTARANTTFKVPGGWSGSVTIYDSQHNWKNVGSAGITGGSGVVSVAFLTGQAMGLVAKFTMDNTQYFQSGVFPFFVSSNISGGFEKQSMEMGENARQAKGNPGRATARGPQVDTGTQSVNASRKVTSKSRSVSLSCPEGFYPLEPFASSGATNQGFSFSQGDTGVKITAPKAAVGTRMSANVLCRARGAQAQVQGQFAYGTRGNDVLTNRARNSFAFAGPGNDRVALGGAGSVAIGGRGRDRMVVQGEGSSAMGGPGPDRLVARGSGRMLLNGGQGPDVLVGGTGDTLMNARDSKGHDRIVCRSALNRVMADAGDTVVGPCQVAPMGS